VKSGLQSCQRFQRSIRARQFVPIEKERLRRWLGRAFWLRAVAIRQRSDFYLDGYSLILEFFRGQRRNGLFVRV